MGTTYNIKYVGEENPELKANVDSILTVFNKSVSTYIPNSTISLFNNADSVAENDTFMNVILSESKEVFIKTGGAFDPTVMPLVDYWGFGPGEKGETDSTAVDSLKSLVGFENIAFSATSISKTKKEIKLDFSAIAKGYGVDIVSNYMLNAGATDHFVEIGGEVMARGRNKEGNLWKVGITHPLSENGMITLFGTLELNNQAIATSGNYFNYYEENGIRYSHTIDPVSGFPSLKNILSASIVAENCMQADAFATAAMVVGHERAIEMIKANTDIEGIIIYSGDDGEVKYFVSEGLKENFQLVK